MSQPQRNLVAIGDEGGALSLKLDASEDVLPHIGGAHPVPTFDWDNGVIPVTPHQEQIVARVAEITNVPE